MCEHNVFGLRMGYSLYGTKLSDAGAVKIAEVLPNSKLTNLS